MLSLTPGGWLEVGRRAGEGSTSAANEGPQAGVLG